MILKSIDNIIQKMNNQLIQKGKKTAMFLDIENVPDTSIDKSRIICETAN